MQVRQHDDLFFAVVVRFLSPANFPHFPLPSPLVSQGEEVNGRQMTQSQQSVKEGEHPMGDFMASFAALSLLGSCPVRTNEFLDGAGRTRT